MATGTAATIGLGISAASAAVGTAASIKQASEGRARMKEAQRALDEYQRQDLENVYAGMSVPMQGFEMRRDLLEQQQATGAQMMSRAGARGMAFLPGLVQQGQLGMRQIAADIEQSQFRIQQMIASDEARIQQMQERREEQDIAGLGAEIAGSRQQYQQGVAGAIGSIGQFGTTLYGLAPEATPKERDFVPTIQTGQTITPEPLRGFGTGSTITPQPLQAPYTGLRGGSTISPNLPNYGTPPSRI